LRGQDLLNTLKLENEYEVFVPLRKRGQLNFDDTTM